MMGVRYFGVEVRRIEDPKPLTGQGRYVADLKIPGALHAAFVRSTEAHALCRLIEASCAAVAGNWRALDPSSSPSATHK